MAAEWSRLCKAPDLKCDADSVDVTLGDGRRHRVDVEQQADAFVLSAIVVRQSKVASQSDLPVQAWLRNRAVALVGFRIDKRGRMVGEAWMPKIGLTADEFQLVVRTVAVECDRFEYVLTGRDVE